MNASNSSKIFLIRGTHGEHLSAHVREQNFCAGDRCVKTARQSGAAHLSSFNLIW
jgi:hypothetical protein